MNFVNSRVNPSSNQGRRSVIFVLHLSLLVLLWSLLVLGKAAVASQDNIRFQRYTQQQGLSQQAVLAVLQDRSGFMWFATQEGLNRFDGYQFRVFYHNPDNANSLSNDAVYSIIEDHQGYLWLGTDGGGLDRFDPVSEIFTHYTEKSHQLSSDRVNVVFEDKDNNLWVGTDGGGLNRLHKSGLSFESYRHDQSTFNSLNHDNVKSIHQDRLGRLWIGTDNGLNLFDVQSNRFENFKTDAPAPTSLKSGSIRTIFSDNQSNVWVGTNKNGLTRINRDQSYAQYQHNANDTSSLCHNRVRDILEDNKGLIWIATDNGLCQWQPQSQQFLRFTHDPKDLYSLGDNRTLSLYQDRGGVLWLGTFGGLNKWTASDFAHYRQNPGNLNSLSSNIINAFGQNLQDPQGDIWVGSYDGLNRLNPVTEQIQRIEPENGLSDNRIMSLKVMPDSGSDGSIVWIGSRSGGLDRYDPATNRVTNFQHDETNPTSISSNGITDIFADQNGEMWVATYGGGLNRFHRSNGTLNKSSYFSHFRHNPAQPKSLSSDRILTISQSTDGFFWIGTEDGGLNRFDSTNGEFEHYRHDQSDSDSLSSDAIFSILEGPHGDLWIGTWGGSLNRWRAKDRHNGIVRFEHYGKQQGLLSTMIYDIVADKQGQLWFSSNRGLTRFDPITAQFRLYDVSHGLQDNEFNHNAAFVSNTGQLFFGGSNGFNAFYPDKIANNNHQPPVVLTGIQKLNNQTGTVNVLMGMLDMVFGYQDYALSFDFAGLDYTAPQKNRYMYKLEGFDQDWVDIGQARRTTFTNLPADDYVFRVKASNNDGVWSEQGLAVNIRVTPPPWKTWWAYSLYALVIFSIIGAYLKAHRAKLREKAEYSRHLENQVVLRTSELTTANKELVVAKAAAEAGDQAKGTFIATMSHELRTPMTAIIGFAESILEDSIDSFERQRRIDKILRNANHLLQLMNNVLDISKIEVKRLDLEHIAVQPVWLLQELQELIGQQASEKQLTLDIQYHYPIPAKIHADPTRLKQILLNLCNNAIKFTAKGGITIDVSANQTDNTLHFNVKDTGIGIAQDKLVSVFEAFSQADSSTTRKFGGTGLGLSISKQLCHAMKGEMTLASEEGQGSQFSFYISMGEPPVSEWLQDAQAITDSMQNRPTKAFTVPSLSGHVLLAEDWVDNQELIQMYIKRCGVQVTLAENGQQAIEAALAQSFDLILMDVQMPEVDGIEATQILRATGFSNPIIALTANVSKGDIEQYLTHGFDNHLSKPIEREAFYQTLAANLPAAGEAVVEGNSEEQHDETYLALVASFLERLPTLMDSIEQAAEQQNWQQMSGLLHNLKGLGGSFGYPALSQMAQPMVETLEAGQNQQALAHLVELKHIAANITEEFGATL